VARIADIASYFIVTRVSTAVFTDLGRYIYILLACGAHRTLGGSAESRLKSTDPQKRTAGGSRINRETRRRHRPNVKRYMPVVSSFLIGDQRRPKRLTPYIS